MKVFNASANEKLVLNCHYGKLVDIFSSITGLDIPSLRGKPYPYSAVLRKTMGDIQKRAGIEMVSEVIESLGARWMPKDKQDTCAHFIYLFKGHISPCLKTEGVAVDFVTFGECSTEGRVDDRRDEELTALLNANFPADTTLEGAAHPDPSPPPPRGRLSSPAALRSSLLRQVRPQLSRRSSPPE